MVRRPQSSMSLDCWLGPRFRSLFSGGYGVERHFIGLLEKGHRPPKHPETLRLQVAVKVLPGIPFCKKTEFIFVLHILAEVAAPASFLGPHGADQGYDRLGQLLALLRKDLHSYDDQDHANSISKWPANHRQEA